MTTLTMRLERGPNPAEVFAYGPPTHPPATPGEWFARRYPSIVQQWGAPILEAITTAVRSGDRIVQPLTLNDNFFAAILSDPQLGHSVVFYQPEQQWYFADPLDNHYHPVAEEKLVVLLSALLSRCAGEMPRDVDLLKLFRDFRSDEVLEPIVKRARAILAADHTFFSADSPQRRVEGVENQSRMAVRFVRAAVKEAEGRMLSIGECYVGFSEYCRSHSCEPVVRHHFKRLMREVFQEEFGLSLRGDLKNQAGKYLRGWKGLTLETSCRN